MNAAPVGRWLLIAAALVIVATVAAAIVVMGSPSEAREARLDERRVRDLDRIADVVRTYAQRHGQPPADLAALAQQPGVRLAIADPVSAAPYPYRVSDADSFRLCASFSTDTAKIVTEEQSRIDRHWLHGAGEQCFDLKVDDNRRE